MTRKPRSSAGASGPSPQLDTLFLPSEALRKRQCRPYQAEAVEALDEARERLEFSILALPTGAGKTFVANEVVNRAAQTGRVLWLALNWELLVQASSGYVQRFGGMSQVGRLGGGQSPLRRVLREDPNRPVQYSTLHTWYRRREQPQLSPEAVALVVIDECHWGMNGAMGHALLQQYHGQVALLGLSATPREVHVPEGTPPPRVAYRKTFADLEGTYLASPRLLSPETHTAWRPQLAGTGDFTAASLRELATDAGRNELICRTLLAGIRDKKFSRVMVFACNVEHADQLADLFARHGIDARALHYEVSSEARRAELIASFKRGAFNVIVNVAMLTHGVDVPDVDAVFLTRPTASEVLCGQMVGRGARRIEGQKHHFWVVEFTDNVARHRDHIFHARELLPATSESSWAGPRARTAPRHLPPPRSPRLLRLAGLPGVTGLTYVEDQTFGVEIELTSPHGSPDATGLVYSNWQWRLVGASILREIARVATLPVDRIPRNYHEVSNTDRWRVEFDRSAGWEVVSPILKNQEGFTELVNVLRAVQSLVKRSEQLHINHRTGLHVTLGSDFRDDRQVQGLLRLTQRLEPGLFTLVSPSRLYELEGGQYHLDRPNRYCVPLRHLQADIASLGLSTFEQPNRSMRCRTVNLSNVGREHQHIEVRMHNGTTHYPVVVAWTSLWMTLFNRARFHWPEYGDRGAIFPSSDFDASPMEAREEDLFELLLDVDVHIDPVLRQVLRRRRERLLKRWEQVIPRRVKAWKAHWRTRQEAEAEESIAYHGR